MVMTVIAGFIIFCFLMIVALPLVLNLMFLALAILFDFWFVWVILAIAYFIMR